MAGGATQEVMQEYLVKLGFKTDLISLKKFEDSLGKTGKSVMKVGLGVAGVMASVEAAAAAFAYSMRKTYFAAELANSSVKSMQAMSYAGKQFGISGDSMASSIKGMASAMRANPGLQGLVESFGVKVTGRDTSDVMMDFVKAIKSMPESVGQQYAAMFGMDPDTYHMMITHFDGIIAKRNELSQMQKEAGVDIDKQKEGIMKYTAAMDKLSARFDLFASTFLSAMNPVFEKTVTWLDHIVEGWTWAFSSDAERKASVKARKEARNAPSTSASAVPNDIADRHARIMRGEQVDAGGNTKPTGTGSANDIMGILMRQGWSREQAAGIAANLKHESGFNPGAVGDNGKAYGLAQWHPDRQEQFKKWSGKDIKGSSMEDQLGFLNYELREGNERRAGTKLMGAKSAAEAAALMTSEYERPADVAGQSALRAATATRLSGVSGATVSQTNNTTINVTGNGATETASAVGKQQTRVMGDGVRMLKGAVG